MVTICLVGTPFCFEHFLQPLVSCIFISMLLEQIIRRTLYQYLEEKGKHNFKKPRKYSKSYCESTPCNKMGFTQKASCRPYKNCYK